MPACLELLKRYLKEPEKWRRGSLGDPPEFSVREPDAVVCEGGGGALRFQHPPPSTPHPPPFFWVNLSGINLHVCVFLSWSHFGLMDKRHARLWSAAGPDPTLQHQDCRPTGE
ncbi:unnamed protein product [Pleuronectes platessa]|uniref:Uncharacterized protein n=1 Tax=Pleuronectes platessa TaxID=8262 RepID=A0A9N7TSB3_PLEPL|nr:unnamed protein product [Pleuronectes platessa]